MWTDNSLLSASVDGIPLGAWLVDVICNIITLYKYPLSTDVCYAVMVYPWLQRYRGEVL